MVTNCLSEQQRLGAGSLLNPGHGFGLGVAMVLDPVQAGPMPVRWGCGGGGLAGRLWRLVARRIPNQNTVLIFLAHNMVELEQLYEGIGLGVYEAIAQFQVQAAALLR